MTATPQDVLREAARILVEEGCWAQAHGHQPEFGVHPRCAVTVIAEARHRLGAWQDVVTAAQDRLASSESTGGTTPLSAPPRT